MRDRGEPRQIGHAHGRVGERLGLHTDERRGRRGHCQCEAERGYNEASDRASVDLCARAVNADSLPANSLAGVQVYLDGTGPVDHEPACDVNTDPLCDGGGPSGRWTNYTLETVQRIGYGSFEPDNGVLIAKNKAFPPGGPSTEGSTCGYGCFTWVEDAHPQNINTVDFNRPDGTPVMRTVGA